MSVWYAIPSIRPNGGTLMRWRARGYKLAVLRQGELIGADIEIATDVYLGWARSVNILSKSILSGDPTANWIVSGGDDYLPEMNQAPEEIAQRCTEHFGGTFGVMQPTGDRWGDDSVARARWGENRGAMLDRIAGSPWMGREWCERAYGGNGPMPEQYFHIFGDEQLQCVAEKLGVFWQCRDLMQYHDHALRPRGNAADWPEFLRPIQAMWSQEQARFDADKAAGFPGSDPLPPRIVP